MLEDKGVKIWIDGGWGVDALLEKQTRPHSDLDIAVKREDVTKLRDVLVSQGYRDKEDVTGSNFVLQNEKGQEIDVHVFAFDEKGNNIYGIEYPKASLTGIGVINGVTVNCVAPEYVLKFHENFQPSEKHIKDIQALCAKFHLEPPENYKKYPEFMI